MDSLFRGLQHIELLEIVSRQTLRQHNPLLEEFRAALDVDLLEAILAEERRDHWRLTRLRQALNTSHHATVQ